MKKTAAHVQKCFSTSTGEMLRSGVESFSYSLWTVITKVKDVESIDLQNFQ